MTWKLALDTLAYASLGLLVSALLGAAVYACAAVASRESAREAERDYEDWLRRRGRWAR